MEMNSAELGGLRLVTLWIFMERIQPKSYCIKRSKCKIIEKILSSVGQYGLQLTFANIWLLKSCIVDQICHAFGLLPKFWRDSIHIWILVHLLAKSLPICGQPNR